MNDQETNIHQYPDLFQGKKTQIGKEKSAKVYLTLPTILSVEVF